MKVSKIPGLGRFGIFIDDVDFKNLTDEEWMEIGQLHLDNLVTIIRDTKLEPLEYAGWMRKWGSARDLFGYRLRKKYNTWTSKLFDEIDNPDSEIDDDDREFVRTLKDFTVFHNGKPTELARVSGAKRPNGRPLGMFSTGELLWHSNESGNLCFTPAVSLLAYENTVGSSTGFVTTTDWYEEQSESFRSELDEMILIHKFTPGKINPGAPLEQDKVVYRNMCPVDDTELPMVIQSPGGITGLHYTVHTVDRVKGMSREESQKLFDYINKTLFVDRFIYDHWYKNEGDLCLFDNSIVLHRRLGDITNRMCYRIQYDYEQILKQPWIPYNSEPFRSEYVTTITDVANTMNKTNYKIPTL